MNTRQRMYAPGRHRISGALALTLSLAFGACSADEDGGQAEGGSGGGGGKSSAKGGAPSSAGESAGGGDAGQGNAGGGVAESGANAGGSSGGKAGGASGGKTPGQAGAAGARAGGAAGEAGATGGADAAGASAGAGGASAGAGGASAGASGAAGAGGDGGDAPSRILVFDGGTRSSGASWSGRAGLDAVCAAAKAAAALPGHAPVALISVGASDQIRDFPALYGLPIALPFESVLARKIADDLADLLDGNLDLSLEAAGVVTDSNGLWFTGSNADGTASPNTCQGWTYSSLDTVIRANYGYTASTDALWLDGSSTATCSAGQYHVLCLTW